ncbi:MAG: hypothetical protein AVDCRST_MAG03-2733, partial [uncultured Rubrobacteraceae bacterium]
GRCRARRRELEEPGRRYGRRGLRFARGPLPAPGWTRRAAVLV